MKATDLARTHGAAFPAAPWSAQTISDLLGQPNVILAGDAWSFVLGRVTLDEAEILTLATDPTMLRQGFAYHALAAFTEAASKAGAGTVFLEVAADNAAARALYAKAGFAQVGTRSSYYKRPNQAPVDALILRKNLAV